MTSNLRIAWGRWCHGSSTCPPLHLILIIVSIVSYLSVATLSTLLNLNLNLANVIILTRHSQVRQGGIISSIYIAEGLHPTGDLDQEELPPRFEIGSSKQKVKWFGALCVTGIGMFVEAYIIITTGKPHTSRN